jgi:DNA modification methylase
MEHEGRGSVATLQSALTALAADIPGVTLHCGDALHVLRSMSAESIDCVVTSPPYYDQRTYANGDGLGNEGIPDEYIDALLKITCELHRVLKHSGSLWLVLDDTRKGKSLLSIPSRLAHRMCDEQGWRLRSEIAWHASKGLDSASDRVRDSHSTIFHLIKSDDYFFDEAALRKGNAPTLRPTTIEKMRRRILAAGALSESERTEALAELDRRAAAGTDMRLILRGHANGTSAAHHGKDLQRRGFKYLSYHEGGARLGSVWDIAPEGDADHPAAFPAALVERCIRLTCPPDGSLLDPFAGSGTVAIVARQLGHRAIAIDITPEYIERARPRLLSELQSRPSAP